MNTSLKRALLGACLLSLGSTLAASPGQFPDTVVTAEAAVVPVSAETSPGFSSAEPVSTSEGVTVTAPVPGQELVGLDRDSGALDTTDVIAGRSDVPEQVIRLLMSLTALAVGLGGVLMIVTQVRAARTGGARSGLRITAASTWNSGSDSGSSSDASDSGSSSDASDSGSCSDSGGGDSGGCSD